MIKQPLSTKVAIKVKVMIIARSIPVFLLLFPFYASAVSFNEAIQNGAVKGSVKLFYYDLDLENLPESYATSLGGHLQYTTGNWNELYAKVGFHTSNAIGSKQNEALTFLFNNDKEASSFTAVSESFLGYRRNQRVLKVGNFRLNTPMMNDDTSRIVPWSYRGIAFTSTPRAGIRIQLNHITHTRSYTSDSYKKESASGTIEDGVTMFGLHYDVNQELSLFGFYYYAPKLFDTFVAQADYKYPVDEDLFFCLGAQYIKSGNGGEYAVTESLRGGDEIDLVALRISTETENWDIGLNYSQNFGISGLLKGYGGSTKLFTTSMIASGRGNFKPETWMLSTAYDFPVYEWGQSEVALHYTNTRVDDSRGNSFDAYYAHFRHYINTNTSLYIRYEVMDYEKETLDGGYLRVIGNYDF
ncbi:MAG: OprD family outer membrane porin [Campylobacterota bacterium]|nr:OprD family outer membrane porin [Campylobacterota bacterium]